MYEKNFIFLSDFMLLACLIDRGVQAVMSRKDIDLHMKYRKDMLRFANSILHDPYLAEDVVQEVFLRLHEQVEECRWENGEQGKRITNLFLINLSAKSQIGGVSNVVFPMCNLI